ncbi:hypothetical protein [Methanosarcina sp.]|uniref:hypothetical protein n=1 Tax=Methanosarcina sp. TaxID=2213 RepID=UPI003BB76B6D
MKGLFIPPKNGCYQAKGKVNLTNPPQSGTVVPQKKPIEGSITITLILKAHEKDGI